MNQGSISVCQKYPRLYQKLHSDLESGIKQNTELNSQFLQKAVRSCSLTYAPFKSGV